MRRAPGFAAEARRQARRVDAGPGFDDAMDFLERVSCSTRTTSPVCLGDAVLGFG